jgi:hypothetical protein
MGGRIEGARQKASPAVIARQNAKGNVRPIEQRMSK